MKAIAVNGSPRKGGNTEMLLKHVLEPLEASGWDTELIRIGGKSMSGCLACGKCWEKKDGRCIQKKDDFNEILEKLFEADALILGSPTYFTDVTPELKALIDRAGFVAMANDRAFAGKIGAAVVAVRRGGALHVFDTINHLFLISQMIVPGSTYWNMGYGRNKGEVAGDAEGIANMRSLGETIAWLGKTISTPPRFLSEGAGIAWMILLKGNAGPGDRRSIPMSELIEPDRIHRFGASALRLKIRVRSSASQTASTITPLPAPGRRESVSGRTSQARSATWRRRPSERK